MRRSSASGGAGEVFADQGYRDQGPARKYQVDSDEEADRPVGGAGELGEDEDADQQAADAAEADQAGARLAAARKAAVTRVTPMKRK